MIPYPSKLSELLRRDASGSSRRLTPVLAQALSSVKSPATVVSLSLALAETVPAIYYGRYLAQLDPWGAVFSSALSFLGTWAAYLLVLTLARSRLALRRLLSIGVAAWTVLLQVVYFGIYREFATLPTVSVVDFVRQTPDYAWALFIDRLDLLLIVTGFILVAAIARFIRWGFDGAMSLGRNALVALSLAVLASLSYAQAPFMSFGQQVAWLITKSSKGPGAVNLAWTPDRVRPFATPPKHPLNFVVFRLEEIAAQATTLERPELATTPLLKALLDEHPHEAFISHQHFSNSTATDVSVLSIYTGLSPAADLEAHRHIPILWDYFSAAGFDTSLFIPFHLEWGDFKRRFNARPDELHLNKLIDAGNSGLPLVYDNSINDSEVIASALDYQQKRGWREPFLQIVSLKMPHAIGEGARVNKLDYGSWGNEPPDLRPYYNGIRHNDELIHEFMGKMPAATREKTAFVFLSDHGTRLFARSDGAEELHRLNNYHQETTKVPFVIYVPEAAQKLLPRDKIDALAENLRSRATSNIDFVPTLLGLAGIEAVDAGVEHAEILRGRDLTESVRSTAAIIQLNTGPLRRWDREHFGLVLGNGRYHYMFSMGLELLFDRTTDPNETRDVVANPVHAEVVANARSIVAEVPELLRIQQKYRNSHGADSALLAHAAANMPSKLSPAGTIHLSKTPNGEMQKVAEFSIGAGGQKQSYEVEFVARVRQGKGRLDWELRSRAGFAHTAHSEQLSSGIHRFAFRWEPDQDEALEVRLRAVADSDKFAFDIEKGVTAADERGASRFEMLALSSGEPGEAMGAYALDRFRRHPCLSQGQPLDCPNGYLVWGPYVKAPDGASVRLRYDVQIARTGLNLWFDLATAAGRDRIAQSRTYRIDQVGSHSFEFNARVESGAESLEGRLNAWMQGGLGSRPITVDAATLTIESAGVHD